MNYSLGTVTPGLPFQVLRNARATKEERERSAQGFASHGKEQVFNRKDT